MANQIISYQCPYCKHIQSFDFSTCPACGVDIISGAQTRDNQWIYTGLDIPKRFK